MELIADGPYRWRIPRSGGMNVDGLVFASEPLIVKAKEDKALDQVANVAYLPGIVGESMAMPDIHWGYGFPIGGVAATDVDGGGVVSPGGVGFDIGCGVRLLRSNLMLEEHKELVKELALQMSQRIPSGVGGKGLRPLVGSEMAEVLEQGLEWTLANGHAWPEDLESCEDEGKMPGARATKVSAKSTERGGSQLGSLGAGNHFLEVQVVDEIHADREAQVMGLEVGQICVMIHSGSRGLGHQVCTEEVLSVSAAMKRLGIEVPDRQLACAPVTDGAGQAYMSAMAAAANFARANRQLLAEGVRGCFEVVFGATARELEMFTVYDVSHNVAKIERYDVGGTTRNLCVHRKGATRAFGPGHAELPERYQQIGQPVIVPGSMGTASWVAVGTERSASLSFGSTCHGAGRMMSRKAANKLSSGAELRSNLERQGILVRAQQIRLLAEEAPYAYKDVDEVIEVCSEIGLSKKVARMRPVAVIKG